DGNQDDRPEYSVSHHSGSEPDLRDHHAYFAARNHADSHADCIPTAEPEGRESAPQEFREDRGNTKDNGELQGRPLTKRGWVEMQANTGKKEGDQKGGDSFRQHVDAMLHSFGNRHTRKKCAHDRRDPRVSRKKR